MPRQCLFTLFFLLPWTVSLWGQPLFTGPPEGFEALVEPLMTKGERQIFEKLTTFDEKDYFKAIFWHKRDPNPYESGNAFLKEFYKRRQLANERFSEREVSGSKTERGRIFLLLGEPDRVDQQAVLTEETEARAGLEETWHFDSLGRSFRFFLPMGGASYRCLNPPSEGEWEAYRQRLILDRAEPFRLIPQQISLPNIGATKDIENLVIQDRTDLPFSVQYACLRGDAAQTEILVAVSVDEVSPGGIELHLTAFDPYENKVLDVKRRYARENSDTILFSIALEPDQVAMVLRIQDKNGRYSVDRRLIDVPNFSEGSFHLSDLLLARSLVPIPVEGFRTDPRFVFKDRYLDIAPRLEGAEGALLMLETYGWSPESFEVLLDAKVVATEPLVMERDGDSRTRLVFALPEVSWEGFHEIKVLSGSLDQRHAVNLFLEEGKPLSYGQQKDFFGQIPESQELVWTAPQSDEIKDLRVLKLKHQREGIKRLYAYQNNRLFAERSAPPWQIEVDPSRLHLSGDHTFTLFVDETDGVAKTRRSFKPLRIDQTIKTRAISLTFNAYALDNSFVQNLDLERVTLKVDDQVVTPLELVREESPITYLFLVDNSYSMKDSFVGNLRAVKKFIDAMRPMDKGYFVIFSDNYFQLNQPTASKSVLKAVADSIALDAPDPNNTDPLYLENTTYVYDGIIAGIHSLIQVAGRKAAVIVSDGIAIEGVFSPNALLSYARENEVVLYSLWLDNNPKVSEDEFTFLRKEMGKGERFARAIGLSRFYANKDGRKQLIGDKIKKSSITEGLLKNLAEESGGFHYRIFKADRTLIEAYVEDIEQAMGSQFSATLVLPVSLAIQAVTVDYPDPAIHFRVKSAVKVRKTNPLAD